jgi:predicted glycosyltransferase
MNILLDINHPAHVHLFRNPIRLWRERGHNILVVARDKDVTLDLLNYYGISFVLGSVRQYGVLNHAQEMIIHTAKLVRVSLSFKPDIIVSLGSPMAAWASFLIKAPHVSFDDTEHARLEHILYRPFTKLIYTPSCFKDNLGKKQIRYNGYHELAYLHPNWFVPDPHGLCDVGLAVDETYFVVRYVSWEAMHDKGQSGFDDFGKNALIALLQNYGRIIVTSESSPSPKLLGTNASIPPTEIHNLLFYSAMYIGEGGTMATEAAVLGTPSILVSTLSGGNWDELEKKYKLLYSFGSGGNAIEAVKSLLDTPDLNVIWGSRREKMLNEKISLTEFMVSEIERMIFI